MKTRLLVIALLLSVIGAARAEEATDVPALLSDADKRYADLDYRGAAEVAERAAKDPHATAAQRALGWQRVGLSWLVLGQRTLAREAFDLLFAIDGARPIEDASLSPRQREFIEEVRRRHAATVKPPVAPKPDVKPDVKPELKPNVKPDVKPELVPRADPIAPTANVRKPIWKRWYLWVPVAVGVAGLGVGLGLGLGLSRVPNGTLGTVGLGLRF